MNNLTLNIANLFAEVFGVSSPVFIPWGRELKTRIPDNYKDVSLSAKEEAQRSELDELMEKKFEGSLPAFIAAFAHRQKLSEKEIEEIRRIIGQ